MKNKILIGLIGLNLINISTIDAATCSCAGVSLSNTVSLTDFEAGQFQFSLAYTNIDISDLVSGSNDINDETGRFRETDSYIIQGTYGLNDTWALTAIISQIEHNRNIAISNTNVETSNGLGDSLLVLSYAPQKIDPFTKDEWAFGFGLRIPTGENDNGNPIVFAEDLQPGQGAWGGSLWFHYAHVFDQKGTWKLSVDSNYAHVGENDREYSFTNEWNLSSGINYSANDQWSGGVSIGYRNADPHTRFGSDFPNTGGSWLDFTGSLQYSFSPSTSIGLSTTVPISRDLNGSLQFTTKRSITLSISHRLGQ